MQYRGFDRYGAVALECNAAVTNAIAVDENTARIMTECKRIRTIKVCESFTKLQTKNAVVCNTCKAEFCFSREHNMHVKALKEETRGAGERSSYSCRYFVLPCCLFDFCGKYQRRQCKKSQYKEYIDFITDVSTVCGFHTEEDCLRIPSTKRVCIIGKGRRYSEAEEPMVEERRSDYIRGREALFTSSGVSMNVNQCGNRGPHNDNGQNISTPANDWVNGFQPREKTEAVRNCSALPRDFVDAVVLRVAKALLSLTARDIESSDCVDAWNTGAKRAGAFADPRGLMLQEFLTTMFVHNWLGNGSSYFLEVVVSYAGEEVGAYGSRDSHQVVSAQRTRCN
ncbi:hypothetical protein PO909_023539 [Leuciscus waleckii]